VERFTKRRLEPIRFIGGGARSAVWCQIFADVLGRQIEQVADPVNAGARGVGMLAAVALGELTFDEIPDRVSVAASYRPDPAPLACTARALRRVRGSIRQTQGARPVERRRVPPDR
jgi:xylulokinase